MESFDISSPAFEPDALPKPRHARRPVIPETPEPQPSDSPRPRPQYDSQPKVKIDSPERKKVTEETKIEGGSRQKASKPQSAGVGSGLKKVLTDSRLSMFIGIVLLVISAYLSIAFISYLANGADDQSTLQSYSLGTIVSQPEKVSNIGGPIGAWLSETLISRSFGMGAVAVIVYTILLGLSLTGTRKTNFFSLTFKSLVTLIAISVVLGMVTFRTPSVVFWGGEHGYYINKLLYQSTGVFGMIGVSAILVAAMVLIFLAQIAKIVRFVRNQINAAIERREKKRMDRLSAQIDAEQRYESQPKKTESALRKSISEREALADIDTYQKTVTAEPASKPKTETIEIKVPKPSPLDSLSEFPQEVPVVKNYTAEPRHHDAAPAEPEHVAAAESSEPATPAEIPVVELETKIAAPIEEAEDEGPDLYDPTLELSRYRKPSLDLLQEHSSGNCVIDPAEQEMNKERITKVLSEFGIDIVKIEATVGPTITLYEIVPAEGVRSSKIRNLEDDIALSLKAIGVRIIAMPGKGTIGIEVPNAVPQIVSMRSILASKKYQESTAALPMAIGATITNDVYIADLAKMPHLLVAGATGMGKSVGLNAIITSLLYKKHPAELKFVLVDPKMVEFSLYSSLEKHYLAKLPDEEEAIITNMDKVVPTLNSLCIEMDNRYELLKKAQVRNIKEYNEKFVQRHLNPHNGHQFLPYIVVIVDEFADLIMTAGKEIELPIARIAQKARAVGIHMILATQRPSAEIIKGFIKANFPGRIAFRVTQSRESSIILDQTGANQLIGRGDMLFSKDGIIERVQCAFIDTPEVQSICKWISDQTGYEDAYLLPEYIPAGANDSAGAGSERMTDRDPLFDKAAVMVVEEGVGSTTSLQRRLGVGFPRAGKIMDQLERAGIVGPQIASGKPRKVLMDAESLSVYLAGGGEPA